ncbi:MAG: hypothetical protein OXU20_33245 [Myxococcales bacterium]|nr:hypothetical protein [Myxococcales bacterium]
MTETTERTNGATETRWSLILAVQAAPNVNQRNQALGELLKRHERTVDALIRRIGVPPDRTVEDVRQTFFVTLLQRDDVTKLDPAVGSFRAWLKTAVRRHVSAAFRHWKAQRRGNQITDAMTQECPVWCTQEDACDEVFAIETFQHAMNMLRVRVPDQERFAHFEPFLLEFDADPKDRQAAAEAIGITNTNFRVQLHHLRAKLCALLEDVVADYLGLDNSDRRRDAPWRSEVLGEIRFLYHALLRAPRKH